jgi:adenylate cyclase
MQEFFKKRESINEASGKPAFDMLVGIQTYPEVTGIVGKRKFVYDMRVANGYIVSSIKSSGQVGKMKISERTNKLLKQEFNFEKQSMLEAKRKGKVNMYYITNTIFHQS